MIIREAIAIVLATLFLSGVGEAGVRKQIQFARGTDAAVVQGAVIRGERDLYYVTAKAGQAMGASISAVEHNAVFQIYRPGNVVTVQDGFTEIKGDTLPQAGETDDATIWRGTLPVSGKYLIVVGGTRGNATYKLKITIH